MGRAPKGSVESYQVGHRSLNFKIDGTAGTISQGTGEGTIVKNGTGDYTITFRNPARRLLSAGVGLVTASLRHQFHADSAGASVRLLLFGYNNTTPTDGTFYLHVELSHNSRDL